MDAASGAASARRERPRAGDAIGCGSPSRRPCALDISCPSLLLAAGASGQDLGETAFPNSGAPEAQAPFLRGLLLLHSFEYDDARDAFREAEKPIPRFAMAYWGEAMTHNHPVWMQQDRDAALEALGRLAPTPEARAALAPTERERAYLATADVLFGAVPEASGDKVARRRCLRPRDGRSRGAFP